MKRIAAAAAVAAALVAPQAAAVAPAVASAIATVPAAVITISLIRADDGGTRVVVNDGVAQPASLSGVRFGDGYAEWPAEMVEHQRTCGEGQQPRIRNDANGKFVGLFCG